MQTVFSTFYDQFKDASGTLVEPMQRYGEVALRTQALVAEQQVSLMETYIDAGMKQLQALGESKDPKEWLASQSTAMRQCGEKWMETAQEIGGIQARAQEELQQCVQDGFKTVQNGEVKKTSKKTA